MAGGRGGGDVELIRGAVKIEWEELGEGWDGEYAGTPDDKSLLRFYVARLEGGQWVDIDDGSWCTRFPANTTDAEQSAAL